MRQMRHDTPPNNIRRLLAELLINNNAVFHGHCRAKFTDARIRVLLNKLKRDEEITTELQITDTNSTDASFIVTKKRQLENTENTERNSKKLCGTVKLVREEVLNFKNDDFDGNFKTIKRPPQALTSLVSEIVHGTSSSADHAPDIIMISSMMIHNSRCKQRARKSDRRRKFTSKETSSFQYSSIWTYSKLKSNTIFDHWYGRGVLFSYARIRRLIDQLVAQNLMYFKEA